MKNLINLFQKLPELGWGDKRQFTGTIQDLVLANKVLEGQGSTEIILLRATHRQDNDNIVEYKTWLDELTNTENYCAYMLKNYNFINGAFEIDEDINGLDKLAQTLLRYCS
jgi:hypothetical protein